MELKAEELTLSASDVANHLGCHHLTQLERSVAHGELARPYRDDPRLEALQEHGRAHEEAYVEHLEALGLKIDRPGTAADAENKTSVLDLMSQGVDIIVQASLEVGGWHGRPDILRRVEEPSELGDWSYEPVETKLARQTRAETILQLCLYADLLETYQGVRPARMHVITPDTGWEPETFVVAEYIAYYRLVRKRLEDAITDPPETYPEPVSRCETCRWWPRCNEQWRSDDHMSLVAGISRLHRRELHEHGVDSLTSLAGLSLPIPFVPARGSRQTYLRLREQARVQLEQRTSEAPVYELLPVEEGVGLTRLPEPCSADVFFDIEGDAFASSRGLEYLFGWVAQDGDGEWQYTAQWAMNPADEKAAFERFMDEMATRWAAAPDFHIYHFGAYEPGTLKRLMGRHATREELLDQMLRAGLFIDLHTATRQGVRAGVECYSLKDLEAFHGFSRSVALADANLALQAFEIALETGDTDTAASDIRDTVARYDEDDCRSTAALRDWLEARRAEHEATGEAVGRPAPGDPQPSEALSEQRAKVIALMEALAGDVPTDPAERTEEAHGRWLLTQLLDWERREDKVAYWERFRLQDMDVDELFYERQAIAYLEFEGEVAGRGKTPTHRYRFPPQEIGFEKGSLFDQGGTSVGTVAALNRADGYLDIKKTGTTATLHPPAVFESLIIRSGVLADAVYELGEWVRDHGIDEPGEYRAARDLLLAKHPRGPEIQDGNLRQPTENQLDAARRIVQTLDSGVLAVQGPPGTGKTFTAAHVIPALIAEGKSVGITANSHRVIMNILEKILDQGRISGHMPSIIQKVTEVDPDCPEGIVQTTKNEKVSEALASKSVNVVAGTAWLWARKEMRQSVDVLIIDEAGQMAPARALAVALAAQNVVLLGDPRQLEQPVQGSHPEGADVAALDHVIRGHRTIPEDRGLFLDTTFRLPPGICRYTSDFFYEGRLTYAGGVEHQQLHAPSTMAGEGLWLLPVEHRGNQVSSPEEVEAIEKLVGALLVDEATWTDRHGNQHPLKASDILVVAPYNSHVTAIAQALPDLDVGTVDKFQGREAPIVIYSMATSSPEDAPRGMTFLYSDNRTNVATSRAQCAAVLVCEPRLLTPDCNSLEQMRLANAFCGFAELANDFGTALH